MDLQIEQEYPYSIEFDSETQAGLSKKLTDLRQEDGLRSAVRVC